jgi:hypothetical protein
VKSQLILVLIAVMFPLARASAQSIQFSREEITVIVSDKSCTLEGVYYFRNPGPGSAECSILYPLIDTDSLPYPDSITVLDDSTREAIGFERSTEGVVFYLNVPALQTRKIRIWYNQRTPLQQFEYILTSTQAWGRPLERAEFHIVVPESLTMISCSPSFDTKEQSEHGIIYHIKRNNFMPASNLTIQWKRRTQ